MRGEQIRLVAYETSCYHSWTGEAKSSHPCATAGIPLYATPEHFTRALAWLPYVLQDATPGKDQKDNEDGNPRRLLRWLGEAAVSSTTADETAAGHLIHVIQLQTIGGRLPVYDLDVRSN